MLKKWKDENVELSPNSDFQLSQFFSCMCDGEVELLHNRCHILIHKNSPFEKNMVCLTSSQQLLFEWISPPFNLKNP